MMCPWAIDIPIVARCTLGASAAIASPGAQTMNSKMNIGQAAKAAGVSTKMIRHYELIGLLPQAGRSDAGYRLYGERDVSVLRFIRQSRSLGFSMAQIADLIGMWGNETRSSREVKAIAQRHLADLEEKMREIAEMRMGLEKMVQACLGDDQPGCAILDTLAVGSPTQPCHKAAIVKLSRRGANATHEGRPASPAQSSSHLDLMAWMRGVHVPRASVVLGAEANINVSGPK